MPNDPREEEYDRAWKERDDHTDAILQSPATKKVVVAGPGTGKTTLFSKLLETKDGNTLTLSFINALVDDLALGLFGLSDVKTLHGFSASFLQSRSGAKTFPKLSEVIKEDAAVLLEEPNIDFDEIFNECDDHHPHLQFYKDRKDYYGKYYGFADAIYALVKFLETNKHLVPVYEQVVVDEYQDFNKAEVSLIELLAEQSPILLAGDDDQSLYIDLKNADPDHIRRKHGEHSPEYASFPLPFCSRSTRVIVEAVNDVVTRASREGLLTGRVPKPYQYFPSAKKDKECADNPHVIYTQQYEGEMALFIQNELAEVAANERDSFSVLIVCPPQIGRYTIPKLTKALRKRGFSNVTSRSRSGQREPTLVDGLKILLEDKEDNLGWRIAAKSVLSKDIFDALLSKATGDAIIHELVSDDCRKKVRRMISVLRKIRDEKPVKEERLQEFIESAGYDPHVLAVEKLREELLADDTVAYDAPRGIRRIPIKLTTVPSSKGLSGDYVFITHFDDDYYTENGSVSDQNLFAFLVALTRAKKRAYLISSKDKSPVLLDWIDPSKIEQKLNAPHTRRDTTINSKS